MNKKLNKSLLSKSILIGLCSAAALGGVAAPLAASAEVNVYFRAPPPPVRVEVAPAPRRGYVWVPGYWDVRRDRHVWQKGHWVRERRGYHYAPSVWVERDNRWALERGGWRRGDRDGDGVPNRYDRDRDGDGIPNRADRGRDRDRDSVPDRYDRDRDGDGVSNRRDDAPNNPRRN
jgi:hypothetical protein